MAIDDTQNTAQPGTQPTPTDTPVQVAANTPATPASPTTPPATPATSPANNAQPSSPNQAMPTFSQNPNRSVKPSAQQPTAAPPPAAQDHSNDPSVQRAGVLHSVAQALAGGPHYKFVSDVSTGEMKRIPQPLSKTQIGLAIAVEALTGSLAGLAGGRGKGPGAAGMAGFAQGQKLVQAQRDRESQQQNMEQQNMGRHYQVAEANMRMLSLAQTYGRMDEQMHDDLITRGSPLIEYTRQNYPELMKEFVSEEEAKDVKTYPLTDWTRIPQGIVPRLDSSGNQVWLKFGKVVPESTPGAYRAVDNTYAMIRSGAKVTVADDHGPSDLVKQAVKAGLLNDSWLKASPGAEIPVAQAAGLSHKIAALTAADDDLKSYYSHLNGTKVLDTNATDTNESASTSLPPVKDEKIASMIDSAATKYNVPPAVLRALILTESGNSKTGEVNPKAVSPKGAQGLGQLMPGTAKMLGVSDPFDAEQNVNGAAKYLRDLTASKGSLAKALSAYHGIGSDGITTDSEYSQKIMKLAGIGDGANATPKHAPTDLWAEFKKDPSLATALDKFQGLLNQTGSREAAIGKMAEKDPRSAAKIARLYGGHDALRESDLQQKLHEQREVAQIAIDKQNQEAKNKLALDQEASDHLQSFLKEPDNFQVPDNAMSLPRNELAHTLASAGVKVPNTFASLWDVAHYKLPITSYAPRVWQKGAPFEMDTQTAASYITQFINPQFDEPKYAEAKKALLETHSAQSRDGGAIRNADTAVQHLQMLKTASDALANRNMPAFNQVANWFGVQIKGDPKPSDFKAIAEKVNAEVEKVAMGGNTPYVGQLQQGAENLSRNFGPKTVDSIIKDYTQMMAGRLHSIDENYYAIRGEHLDNVSNATTKLFRQYGAQTPWESRPLFGKSFSKTAWQKANPTGDANKAAELAQRQGAEVTN